MEDKAERVIFIDYLRVIACFMVICVHCIEPFYLSGGGTYIRSKADALVCTLLDSALRAAVPLFVIASSYLQFPVRYDTGTFFRKRLLRVFIPLAIWSLLYTFIPYYGMPFSREPLEDFWHTLLNFPVNAGHLWFVYMLAGVYILMPMLSPWIESLSKKGELAFLGLWLFTTLIPFFRKLAEALFSLPEVWGEASWNEFGAFYYVSGFVGYLVLGHFLRRHLPEMSWKKTLIYAVPLWAAGYAVTAGWFWWRMPDSFPVSAPIDLAVDMETGWGFCSFGVALTAIAYILVIRKITFNGAFYRRVVRPVSEASYGMYLMHMFILMFFFTVVSSWGLHTLSTVLITAVFTFAASAVMGRCISALPGGRFIVG